MIKELVLFVFPKFVSGRGEGFILSRKTLDHIPMYIQPDATLLSLFYLETTLHVSGGTTTHHQERKQLYLQHLVFVKPLLLSAAIAADSRCRFADSTSCQQTCMTCTIAICTVKNSR
jgi:hypothetical protein